MSADGVLQPTAPAAIFALRWRVPAGGSLGSQSPLPPRLGNNLNISSVGFRLPFFPVQPDPELGFVLHPLDGATNKVLARAGRGERRDYLDVLFLHRNVLSLGGALAWAAGGKNAGFTVQFLVEEAQRLAHYPAIRLKSRHRNAAWFRCC